MIRHSLNYFLLDLKRKKLHRFGMEVLGKAIQFLNSLDFHKRLRVGFQRYIIYANGVTVFNIKILQFNEKTDKRNELIMIPVPKPKFFARKVPSGISQDAYFDEITARQTHILRDAIDRVSKIHKL